jgi:hypothetical protein
MDPREVQRWRQVNWEALRRLRHVFVHEPAVAAEGSYWSPKLLSDYDMTLGERIRWKWDDVLRGLAAQGWAPPGDSFLDWACGTGVASRALLAQWPGVFRLVRLFDRSEHAHTFAGAAVRRQDAQVKLTGQGHAPLVVVSHVLNELSTEDEVALVERLRSATSVIWVEPGTREHSRRLIAIREQLRGQFHMVAPCTHDHLCGMLVPENERHWCHHFAPSPGYVHQHGGWSRVTRELKIDISSVPYSYLVLDKRDPPAGRAGWSRRIGHARVYKGMAKILDCSAEGVREVPFMQRNDKAFYQDLRKSRAPTLMEWQRDTRGRAIGVRFPGAQPTAQAGDSVEPESGPEVDSPPLA